MGFVEKRDVYRPPTGDAPFRIDELFFSRTDKRGVIKSANHIFKRVSGYEWDELLGAPHKVIRHEDMPKGVFWLFWQSLKRGEPIGAYVKNKAKDGLHYWVYAVALPFNDGFLSVRLKPSSEILAVIEKEYEALLKAEHDDELTPEQSAAVLVERLGALGYDDYDSFSSYALMQELTSRDKQIGNPVSLGLTNFNNMAAAAAALKSETAALTVGFDAISTVPTNMRIIAARLEPSGGAISSLSQNYWEMSEEMSRWFKNYVSDTGSNFSAIRGTLITSQFYCGAARLLQEVADMFSHERRSLGGVDTDNEKTNMHDVAALFIGKAREGLLQVANEAEHILRAIAMMRRFTLGLSSTRVMCNIESARLPAGGGSLVDVIGQLEQFQGDLEGQLDRIETHGHCILEAASTMLSKGGRTTAP